MATKKPAQAALIRALLAKKLPVEKIVARLKKACGGKPTASYVRWLSKEARS
jgi:hypothetical protein